MKWRTFGLGPRKIFFARGREIVRINDVSRAARFLRDNLEPQQLRRLWGQVEPGLASHQSEDELVETLARHIARGRLVPIVTQEPSFPLDAPVSVPLADLAGPPPEPRRLEPEGGTMTEPPRLHRIRVRVVDQRGRPVPGFTLELDLPQGRVERATLQDAASVELDDIHGEGSCVARVLPAQKGEA